MTVTRFNPTTNGDLHIGHAYMALVNQYEARRTGGDFVLRFDDNTRVWIERCGGRDVMRAIAERQQQDLAWLGIEPDVVTYQSENERYIMEFLACSKWQHVVDHFPCSGVNPLVVSDQMGHVGGLTSSITAEKVVADHWDGVDLLIRGLELLAEDHHYTYLCELFGFAPPRSVYLPRLMAEGGGDLSNISKTAGNWSIRDVRAAGHDPHDVLAILARACLRDPGGEWAIDNVRVHPTLSVADAVRLS